MPDAFIIDENFNYEDNPNTHIPHLVDTDLTEFLASSALHVVNVYPLYLKDSLVDNNSNLYFGIYGNGCALRDRSQFDTRDFDNLPDNSYNGDLDLSNYVYLFNMGLL